MQAIQVLHSVELPQLRSCPVWCNISTWSHSKQSATVQCFGTSSWSHFRERRSLAHLAHPPVAGPVCTSNISGHPKWTPSLRGREDPVRAESILRMFPRIKIRNRCRTAALWVFYGHRIMVTSGIQRTSGRFQQSEIPAGWELHFCCCCFDAFFFSAYLNPFPLNRVLVIPCPDRCCRAP